MDNLNNGINLDDEGIVIKEPSAEPRPFLDPPLVKRRRKLASSTKHFLIIGVIAAALLSISGAFLFSNHNQNLPAVDLHMVNTNPGGTNAPTNGSTSLPVVSGPLPTITTTTIPSTPNIEPASPPCIFNETQLFAWLNSINEATNTSFPCDIMQSGTDEASLEATGVAAQNSITILSQIELNEPYVTFKENQGAFIQRFTVSNPPLTQLEQTLLGDVTNLPQSTEQSLKTDILTTTRSITPLPVANFVPNQSGIAQYCSHAVMNPGQPPANPPEPSYSIIGMPMVWSGKYWVIDLATLVGNSSAQIQSKVVPSC